MSLTTIGPTVDKHIGATEHWKSNYNGTTVDSTLKERLVSQRPMWSINRQGYSSSRGIYKTEFTETIGQFGHNPRDILPRDANK